MIPPFVEKAYSVISELSPGRIILAEEIIRVVSERIGKPSNVKYWHWALVAAECSKVLEFTGKFRNETRLLPINPAHHIREETDFWEKFQ